MTTKRNEISDAAPGHGPGETPLPAGIINPDEVVSEKAESVRLDYIAPGSAAHATFLKLRAATEHDTITQDGYALGDIESFGPAASQDYLRAILAQRVGTLKATQPVLQSEDPRKPNYVHPLWKPVEQAASGIV